MAKVIGHIDLSTPGKLFRVETGEPIRICIDEDCPGCGWPERFYDGEQFGCNKCNYRSGVRNA